VSGGWRRAPQIVRSPAASLRRRGPWRALGTVLVALVSTAALATASAEARYELVARWASSSPEALDVDANGDVYVASADAGNNHVTRYSSVGRVVATWGAGRGPAALMRNRRHRVTVRLRRGGRTVARRSLKQSTSRQRFLADDEAELRSV
jgi:hypothetical protein